MGIFSCVPKNKYLSAILLLVACFLSFVDRYSAGGILSKLEEHFENMDHGKIGLLMTVLTGSIVGCAPLFGYLGDRYSRKNIVVFGIALWTLSVIGSTFVSRSSVHYYLFLACRAVQGFGHSAFHTVAPTIIADLFAPGRARTIWITLFYIMTPIGSGMGYVISASITERTGDWRWGMRAPPLFNPVILLLVLLFLQDPERGAAENVRERKSSLREDIVYFCRHKTFILLTVGMTAVLFTLGGHSWWAPQVFESLYKMHNEKTEEIFMIPIIFGGVGCLGGLLGVSLGALIAHFWLNGKLCFPKEKKAPLYVCVVGTTAALPFFFLYLLICPINMEFAWIFIFLSMFFLCFNWSVSVDVLFSVVVPHRRSMANAISTMVAGLAGNAACRYIIGEVSDSLRQGSDKPADSFHSLRKSLYGANAVLVIGIVMLMLATFFVEKDMRKVEKLQQEDESSAKEDDVGAETAVGLSEGRNSKSYESSSSEEAIESSAS